MTKPIIPWPGGKRRLADKLFPLFDNSHTCYVEPFAGAGALLFMRAEPAKVEVLNDINGDIVNLYRCVQHHLDELVRQFRWQLVSREEFDRLLRSRADTLTDIQRAARFLYLQKVAFGAKVTGQTFGVAKTSPPRLNLLRIEEDLSTAHLRLARVFVENESWQKTVKRYDSAGTFFFMDPPYWQTAGYGVEFGMEQYKQLAEVMRSMAGKCLLTVNDHPDIRALFKGFKTSRLQIAYSVGGQGKSPTVGELAIRNY